jgi:hypothetical protein
VGGSDPVQEERQRRQKRKKTCLKRDKGPQFNFNFKYIVFLAS